MAFIESLESRRLFAVSGGVLALRAVHAEEVTVVADVRTFKHELVVDRAAIKADLKRLGTLRTDASLGATADADILSLYDTIKTDVATGDAEINKYAGELVKFETLDAKHPSTTLANDASTADTNLTTAANNMVSQVSADSDTTTVDNDLNAIASANSGDTQTQTDVTTMETDAANNLTTLNNDVNTLVNTDVQDLQNFYGNP